jgi:signal transduction histidine kinase
MESCRLKEIALEVINALAPAATGKDIQLELLADAESNVQGNPELLRMLLRNLLDNAIRHTRHGTSVQVSISQETGATCLAVSDNGPGIAEDERSRVLERFYRPPGTQASGSGLGLSIVKRIADVHDATLQIMAMEEGSGLRVKVCFKS